MLKELHAVLPAADIQRARTFYHDALGLDPDEEYPGALIYRPGQGTAFEVYETDDAGTTQTSQMAWLTDDLDAVMEQLRARGVVFENFDVPGVKTVRGVAHVLEAKAAWFRDTEGNLLCITQMAPRPAAGSTRAGSNRRRGPIWNLELPPELLRAIPAV